jgi:hypothetical protein
VPADPVPDPERGREPRSPAEAGGVADLRPYFDADGRLTVMPARRHRRLALLDHLAQRFEPGEQFDEQEVNRRLREVHEDVAMLRRCLVDEGFLDRRDGLYWRVGGSVHL